MPSDLGNVSDQSEENCNILLKERYDLLTWTSSVEMRTPNLMIPVQIANYVESLPFCKVAVSPKCDRLALMSYARLLDIYTLTGELLDHESSVQVLEESSPEYCLLQFTSSGTLLLSSRSTPHIDVFDNMGAYCYDIPLEPHDGMFDVDKAICGMQTVPNHAISSNDKFIEVLYVLQYSGTFSAYKIGRLSKYTKMWSVQLDLGQTGSFVVLPQYNLLLVSAHHKQSAASTPLCSFRLMDSEPYVEPIRVSTQDDGWMSKLPFSTSFMIYLPKLSLSFDSQYLVSVATSGSLYLFEIPSTKIKFQFNYISGNRPIEACFVDTNEIAIIYDNGVLLRSSLEDIEEKMYSMKIKNKKQLEEEPDQKDIYSGQTIMVTPAQREIFLLSAEGDSSILREAAHKRVQLAGQLWFWTVWNSFKKLVGMAMGESAEPLQMATHVARFDFMLVHSPTKTLQELFDRTLIEHDYARARELANSYDTIDIDVVLKSEWLAKCSKRQLKVDDVESILNDIHDTEWVAEQCIKVDYEDIEVQKSLIKLGISLSDSISISAQVRLLHHWRLLEICRINEDIETYLRIRNQSCLEAALIFARKGDMESLLRIIERNMKEIGGFQRAILSSIPTCVYPTKFEHFLPKRGSKWELEEIETDDGQKMREIGRKNPDAEVLIRNVNIGGFNENDDEDEWEYVEWVREHLRRIDFECGMTQNCVSFLRISIERGFEELRDDLRKWELYSKFISICSSVSESIMSFEDANVKSFVDKFSRLLESELISNASVIILLIEWKIETSNAKEHDEKEEEEEEEEVDLLHNALSSLMVQTNERSTKVLVAFREIRPDLINDQVILECLLNMTSTGADLLQSLGDLPIGKYAHVTSSLSSLMARGVKMTFKSIFESMKEPDGARRVLIKLSRSGHCESLVDWASLRDDVVEMAQGIYGDFITKEEALELIAGEILEDEQIGQHSELMALVLTMKPNEKFSSQRLSAEKSAEVLLSKSDDLMSEATHKDDPLLGKARFFAISAKNISPEKAREKLKWLDAIELAQELGCTMMPIAIKLSDRDNLLHEIVQIGQNYKYGKKIAKLAVLLDIDTPVATGLSYCALAALAAGNVTVLTRYIGEVIAKAKGIPVVHQLCMKIMQSQHVPTDMGDIYHCAMMNCSALNLLPTVEAIAESEERLKNVRNSTSSKPEIEELPICDLTVPDDMYTSIKNYNKKNVPGEKLQETARKSMKNVKRENFANTIAYESSTLALFSSLMLPTSEEEAQWTTDEKLKRYERSLRYFEEIGVPLSILVEIPPAQLIRAANQNDDTITAIDRIEDYKCNKNRFLNDQEYRVGTIIGLAMTENDQQFSDALELAQKYNVDEWKLHMTSLENAFDTLSIGEVKIVLRSRGHLSKLRTRLEDFHSSLRSSVLPLLSSNEQFLAYTSLFAETEPEKRTAPVIKKILEKRKEAKATKMWKDSSYLSSVLCSIPDKILWTIVDTIMLIPIGEKAGEMAARVLLDGTDLRPPAHPFTLFLLLRRDVEEFLELVAVKTRQEEIDYLDNATVLLEATPNMPIELKNAVRERVEQMRRSTITPEANYSSGSNVSDFSMGFRNSSEQDFGMMKRRRN